MTNTGEPASADHEHLFPEEQEPTGRLILAPCMTCGFSAMDGLAMVASERDKALTTVAQMRLWAQATASGFIPPWASDSFGFGYAEAQTDMLILIGEDDE